MCSAVSQYHGTKVQIAHISLTPIPCQGARLYWKVDTTQRAANYTKKKQRSTCSTISGPCSSFQRRRLFDAGQPTNFILEQPHQHSKDPLGANGRIGAEVHRDGGASTVFQSL